MSTAVLGGISIGYEDQGSGEPLVLVHGHPFDRSMWNPQIESLSAAGWRVIAPDLRGYGESSVVPGLTTLTTFARDVVTLLDSLGIERFVLAGLSMGGQIVLELYRLLPQRIRALVLADTFAAAEGPEGKVARNALADRLLSEGLGPYADEVLNSMMAPHNVVALPQVAKHVSGMMHGAPPEGAAAALRGRAERPDYLPLLPQIAVPTLVIVGSEDAFTPIADAEVLHSGIRDSTLAIIPEAGHLPNLERPAQFNDALHSFLSTLPAEAASAKDR